MKINIHTSHASAFISSTFVDLKQDRAEVAKILESRGLNVNALDTQPASSQSSKNAILKGILESDFVILIIGDRYGSILPSMTGSHSQSITFWEYRTAIKMGKPVIAYFKSVNSGDPNTHDDINENDYLKKRKQFDLFKKIVTQRHNPAYYSSPDELAYKIDSSLISIYRSGVRQLSADNSDLVAKIATLEEELRILKASSGLKALSNQTKPNLLSLGLNSLKDTSEAENTLIGLASLTGKNKV